MAQAIMKFLTFRFITHPLFSIFRLPFYRELKIQILFFEMPNSQPDKGVFKKVSVYEDAREGIINDPVPKVPFNGSLALIVRNDWSLF